MSLAPAWVVRVHVPIGARSRRRPFAEVRAVLDAIHRHPSAGTLGKYRGVEHLSVGLERFVTPGTEDRVRVLVVTITTYVHKASLEDIESLARAVVEAHPWERPVIHCTGPDGAFVWLPEA
jgi:hypothetical protein